MEPSGAAPLTIWDTSIWLESLSEIDCCDRCSSPLHSEEFTASDAFEMTSVAPSPMSLPLLTHFNMLLEGKFKTDQNERIFFIFHSQTVFENKRPSKDNCDRSSQTYERNGLSLRALRNSTLPVKHIEQQIMSPQTATKTVSAHVPRH